ncbi:hypothetical protein OJ997_00635 [Solirubrobacter phytolaccae]|uniref:Uncharacterized protein n=1 Tax=Solirubrobacter phytolaccae TaxID=1404360 RepID=A0A9X3N396_9ACTN|nr:hypothetical protein [Solirubrobacter phytolaccae]MDA0178784.1 hypothetical protein [Solirubrobacter phytolaccae]
MTTIAVNTACQITNSAGQPLVVVDASNTSAATAHQGYQQQLKVLPLGSGAATLAAGASDTVTLNDTYTDPKKTGPQPSYLYQLLLSSPTGLFPVMNVSEAVSFTAPIGYPAIEATAAAAANMVKAATFVQNLMAYPGSDLAKGFNTAMSGAQGQSTASGISQAVADYFNSTKSFQGLDLGSYIAVSTHMKTFAWTWGLSSTIAAGTLGRTYYLYSTSDAQGANKSKTPSSQGKVVLTAPSSPRAVADPTDPNSGMTIVFTDPSGSSTNLTFSNGAFVNDASSDNPSICLIGSYALKSTYTQKPADSTLWPILTGTLNGTKVIGVDQAPEDAVKSWLKSLMPTDFNSLEGTFQKLVGLWMALDFLKSKLGAKKEALEDAETNQNEGEPPTQEQIDEADATAAEVEQSGQAELQAEAARAGSGIEVPEAADIPATQDAVKAEQVEALDDVQGDAIEGSLAETGSELQDLAEVEVTPDLESAEGDVMQAEQDLADARQSGDFKQVETDVVQTDIDASSAEEAVDSEMSQAQQQEAEAEQAEAEEMEDAAEEAESESEETESGDSDYDSDTEIVE